MSVLQTFVSLVVGIAWPFAIGLIVVLFRSEIQEVARSRNARLKAGPFELGIEQVRQGIEFNAVIEKLPRPFTGVSSVPPCCWSLALNR